MIENIKKQITDSLQSAIYKTYQIKLAELELDFPPDIKLGDFSFGCFGLAGALKKSPIAIAEELASAVGKNSVIKEITATGSYLNFRVNESSLFGALINQIVGTEKRNFLQSQQNQGEIIMVEYLSPNTNKPLHLGHLRNGALGMAISGLLENSGASVVKANLINDRGIHICKSMLAWQKWGNNSTPQSFGMKGDHFVGHWYVEYSKQQSIHPEIEEEAREMLRKWEEGDPGVRKLWEQMNAWVYDGFNETFKKLNLQFDKIYYESETYNLGKDLVDSGLKKGVFKKEENGAITALLPAEIFGTEKDGALKKATLIRADGTSVYLTQDLGTAKLKIDENNLTQSIYVVGSEQDYHFMVLFQILKMLGFSWADKLFHLSYGMVYLPEGKMKSREGIIVDADDLVSHMIEMAEHEIKSRDKDGELPREEVLTRSKVVADAAIKYYLLQYNPRQDIHFDPKASLSFEGNTGPYCQYTYARAKSILSKVDNYKYTEVDYSALVELEERILANRLIDLREKAAKSASELNPAQLVAGLFELCKAFNQYYHKHQVIGENDEKTKKARLMLVRAISLVIKQSLSLLNIKVLEKM